MVDSRSVRFSAAVASVVLAIVIITQSPFLALFQTLVFATSAILGHKFSLYGNIFKFIRTSPPTEDDLEPPVGPRMAAVIGAFLTGLAFLEFLMGQPIQGAMLAGVVLFFGFLNAAFDLCVSCEILTLAGLTEDKLKKRK